MYGCANFSRYSSILASVAAASDLTLERGYENRPRIAGIDDVVEIAAAGGDVWMREFFPILFDLGFRRGSFVLALGDFLAKQDLDRSLRTHHRYFGGWPRDVEVASNVLGAHDVVRAAVGLAGY